MRNTKNSGSQSGVNPPNIWRVVKIHLAMQIIGRSVSNYVEFMPRKRVSILYAYVGRPLPLWSRGHIYRKTLLLDILLTAAGCKQGTWCTTRKCHRSCRVNRFGRRGDYLGWVPHCWSSVRFSHRVGLENVGLVSKLAPDSARYQESIWEIKVTGKTLTTSP